MSEQPQTTLVDYLRTLRRSRLLIVLVTLACAGVALAYSLAQERTYEATAQLTVRDPGADLGLIGKAGGFSGQTPLQLASTHAPQVTRGAVVREVQRETGSDGTIDETRELVDVQVDPNSNALTITADSEEAAEAARIANAFAEADAGLSSTETRESYARAAERLSQRIERLEVTENATAAAIYVDRLSTLQSLSSVARPVQVSAEAQVPSSPASPKPVRNTVAAAVIGLLLGIGLAYARGMLDRRLREPGDAEAVFENPALVRLRPEVFGHTGSLADAEVNGIGPLAPIDAESIRMLRENVRYLAIDRELQTIAVTSAIPEEGKSSVAACLAMAYASGGKRTLLVECDLRRRVLAGRLGIAESPGLSDYLVGRARPSEILQSIPAPAPGMNGGEPPALVCITAGSAPPRPADLLSSERFASFLASVGKAYDQVVIDCPPLLPVADTLEIVPHVSCVLMCVRLNRTTVDQAEAGREALERIPARPTGLVITDFTERGGRYYYRDYYNDRGDGPVLGGTTVPPATTPARVDGGGDQAQATAPAKSQSQA